MSTIIRNSTGAITVTDAAAVTSTSESGGSKKTDAIVIAISDDQNTMTINQHHNDKETSTATTSGPSTVCEALRQQNDALRQELHDIRREMDEITDQFRTEDAEEFKQLQAELEIAAKNCRILQFKLRKAEKRNENMECEKAALEDTIQRLTRDNYRTRDLDEELLIAKEVSVRLHSELEKSEESRMITEKLNIALKQHLDTLKESFNEKISTEINDEYHSWQLSINLYESLFREYILMEELTCLNSKKNKRNNQKQYSTDTDGHDVSDLMNSYQQKISVLNDEINQLKQDVINRDSDLSQLRIQNKILKQRSRSVDRTTNSNSNDDEDSGGKDPNRYRRGVSVDGGGNLREQLDASLDEVRLLKNKILRLEDELNSSALEKETLLVKLDNQSKQGVDDTIHEDLRIFTDKTDNLIASIKDTKVDGKIINDLQQSLRSSRLNKQNLDDENSPSLAKTNQQTSEIFQQANEFLTLLQNKNETLNKIRYRLTNLTYDAVDTCTLLEELDTRKHDLEDTKQLCNQLQTTIDNLHISSKTLEEKLQEHTKTNQTLEKNLEKQKKINGDLQQENTRLSTLNAKQLQDLRHIEQLRQSIITFEKKLDQKQTRVNELSMKIIEKEDIIETKVKECQKHRLELRELETKYYTLGKQLEEQIMAMTKEMEKLNVEKEMLKFDLESLRLNQQNERPKSVAMEDEITRAKAECRQQIFDGEIESYKLRLNQSNYEKDELLKFTKDLEKKYKDLQVKYDADEQSWMRVKTEMSEKQRKYDESIKIKSELQNAVDRLRQKLYDLELYGQEKQNKYNIDKQQWETQRIELSGKINELEEQLSKVTKRQRKELETTWKKERTDLQKQLQQSQQLIKDLQKQISNREVPIHLTEKINVLMTENELLLTKIRELEIVVDDVHLLKTEMHRLRDKNSSDWNYWRKQQSDLYAQLRQQYHVKEAILHKFDRLQKHIKSGSENNNRLVRDLSVGPLSINSFQNEGTTKTSLSNFSRETLGDDIELPHGTIDGGGINAHDIVGAMDDSIALQMSTHDNDKQRMFTKTYSAQENTAASIEEIASKIDRVEDNLFSYRRFMDFIRAKSEKSASIVRDDSFSNISNSAIAPPSYTRLASAPPENVHTALSTTNQRRSRLDANTNSSHEHLPTSTDDAIIPELMSNSVTATTNGNGMGSSKNRFFSLSRRFRFRAQSPDKESESEAAAQPATVHFLDEDIDLETKERTARKSDLHGNRPSKGILKALRHRSPFRFRSKDAIIPEQEPSPSPQSPAPSEKVLVSPVPSATLPPKETRGKVLPPAPTQPKQRGRLVELRKTTSKSSPNTTSRKGVNSNPTPTSEPTTSGSTLVRRASGLKDLIHKFEATPSDRPAKPKRVTIESSTSNATSRDISQDDQSKKGTSQLDVPNDDPQRLPINKSKSIDMPDLLRNVSKDTTTTVTTTTTTKAILRHSNSNRQTASFDSTTSMVSASESILTTNSSTRRPTSTARPLMISLSKDES